jgi:hypothetical protein
MLVDLLYSVGYHGYREGLFFSLMFTIDRAIDRHFLTFNEPDNKQILVSNVDIKSLKSRVLGVFKQIGDVHQKPWFDKTGNPEMIHTIPIIRQLWPNSVFIFMKRRGIENVRSRLKKFPTHGFRYHCADWARNMLTWSEVRTGLPSSCYIEIDQQDMIADGKAVAERIAGFLDAGVDAADKMTNLMKSSRPQETAAGSAELIFSMESVGWTEAQREVFMAECKEAMVRFGYRFDEKYRD